jgi:hypothetical protein
MPDDGEKFLSGNLNVPPAELSKGLVVTGLSRLKKIIIRAPGNDQWHIMAVARWHHCEWGGFECPRFVSSSRPGSL